MSELTYQETAQNIADVVDTTWQYIFEGNELDQPYRLKGLVIYGIVAMLRENDDIFHADEPMLSDEELTRVRDVEDEVDIAINENMQFYPFGHKDPKRLELNLDSLSGDAQRRSMNERSGLRRHSARAKNRQNRFS